MKVILGNAHMYMYMDMCISLVGNIDRLVFQTRGGNQDEMEAVSNIG